MGRPIDIEQKGWVLVIHDHGCDLLVIKVRCKDLSNNDWVDFRCRYALDLAINH